MKDAQTFQPRTAALLIAVGIFAFLSFIVFSILAGDAGRARTASANSFSNSAIGHKAFTNLLRELDVPIVVSRNQSALRAIGGSLLMVLEPNPGAAWEELRGTFHLADKVIVTLPKRFGVPRADKPDWLSKAQLLSRSVPGAILRSFAPGASLVRLEGEVEWNAQNIGPPPSIPNIQLMRGAGLEPLIASEEGIFLARVNVDGKEIYLLSDPDFLANHGLKKGGNARLVMGILDYLRDGDEGVVLDETVHGFLKVPSLWRSLLEFPLVVATVVALVAMGLLTWAATGRFGPLQPLAPPLQPGHAGLIENATRLLFTTGHEAEILQRYWRVQLRDVLHALHVPARLGERETREWLARLEIARGLKERAEAFENEVAFCAAGQSRDRRRLLKLARRIYLWKRELLNGSRRR